MRFNSEHIVRDVQDELFQHSAETDAESLFHQALEALEEDNYCDFEVRFYSLYVMGVLYVVACADVVDVDK